MLAHPLYTLCNYSSAATSSPPVPFFFPSSTSSKSYNMSPPFPRSNWKFQVALIDLDLCCRYSLGNATLREYISQANPTYSQPKQQINHIASKA
uniref:Uncharacterized protein n=1 Tax=Salix viminalis TaxID=40686 RepID=A0A6N2KXA9_SALVM